MTAAPGLVDTAGQPIDATTEARRTDYPKWATLCRLRQLGFPTLSALLVLPTQIDQLGSAVHLFAEMLSRDELLLRSDGGIERTAYYVGGGTHLLDRVEAEARSLLDQGRAILLMEPTDRYSNRLTANLRIDQERPGGPGALTIEVLGPGFDVGDLNRGGILPEVTLELAVSSWQIFESPWLTDFRISRDHSMISNERRRHHRLERIARILLPSSGDLQYPGKALDAERWLKEQGNSALWESLSIDRVLRRAKRWYEDAFVLANSAPSPAWITMGTSMSNLGAREVFWDIVDGARKYSLDPRSSTDTVAAIG